MPTNTQYFPGIGHAARLAYDVYWTAHLSEEDASDQCPQIHVDADGHRLPNDRCAAAGDAGRAHCSAISAVIAARSLYDHLRGLEIANLDTTSEPDPGNAPADSDELTKIARAVFEVAAGTQLATVSGRTRDQQQSQDARTQFTDWRR